jgi:hypothetical protein
MDSISVGLIVPQGVVRRKVSRNIAACYRYAVNTIKGNVEPVMEFAPRITHYGRVI